MAVAVLSSRWVAHCLRSVCSTAWLRAGKWCSEINNISFNKNIFLLCTQQSTRLLLCSGNELTIRMCLLLVVTNAVSVGWSAWVGPHLSAGRIDVWPFKRHALSNVKSRCGHPWNSFLYLALIVMSNKLLRNKWFGYSISGAAIDTSRMTHTTVTDVKMYSNIDSKNNNKCDYSIH